MVVAQRFYVGFNMIDESFNIKNSAMLNFFVDIAGIHSAKCGESFETSENRWLLLGYKLKIFRRPRYGEFVDISTWSSKFRGITALREFEIRNENGELMVACLSNWVSINMVTRRMERLTEERMAPYDSEPNRTNFEGETFDKLAEPENYDGSEDVLIDWKLIDLNKHLNNANYMDVVEQVLPAEKRKLLNGNSFEVMYKKEILENQTVQCCYKIGPEEIVFAFKNKDSGELHSVIKFNK